MKISALLSAKGTHVSTIRPELEISVLVSELTRLGIGAMVVSTDGRLVTGIVSERDVVTHLESRQGALLGDTVATIMSTSVHTCAPEDEVETIMRIMTEHRVRHVPVLHDGELCGLVSIGDVVKSRIGELEADRQALYDYIGAR
jgi:CBS domain-containing protein